MVEILGARSRHTPPMLITVEGLDGAGKTTLITGLAAALERHRPREPGGVELSERIRDARRGPLARTSTREPRRSSTPPPAPNSSPSASARCCNAGETVLLDRFVDSSLAYQGGGRELGIDEIRSLNAFATGRHQARPHAPAAHRPDARPRPHRRPRSRPPRERRRSVLRAGRATPTTSSPPPSPHSFVVLDAAQPPEAVLGKRHAERFSSRPGAPGATPRRRATMSSSDCSGVQPEAARGRARWTRRAAAGRRRARPSSTDAISRPVTRARRLDHLAHRVAALAAEVVDVVAAGHGLLQREHVRAAEVLDVDVVADRGAVRRRVVGAEDRDALALARRGLQHERDQMRLGVVVLARARPLAPATLK